MSMPTPILTKLCRRAVINGAVSVMSIALASLSGPSKTGQHPVEPPRLAASGKVIDRLVESSVADANFIQRAALAPTGRDQFAAIPLSLAVDGPQLVPTRAMVAVAGAAPVAATTSRRAARVAMASASRSRMQAMAPLPPQRPAARQPAPDSVVIAATKLEHPSLGTRVIGGAVVALDATWALLTRSL